MNSTDKAGVIVVVSGLLALLGATFSCHAHTAPAITACREACGGQVESASVQECKCR